MKTFTTFIQQLLERYKKEVSSDKDDEENDENEDPKSVKDKDNKDKGKKRPRRQSYVKFNNGEDDGQTLAPRQT